MQLETLQSSALPPETSFSAISLSANFCTLPDAVLGKESVKKTNFGTIQRKRFRVSDALFNEQLVVDTGKSVTSNMTPSVKGRKHPTNLNAHSFCP